MLSHSKKEMSETAGEILDRSLGLDKYYCTAVTSRWLSTVCPSEILRV